MAGRKGGGKYRHRRGKGPPVELEPSVSGSDHSDDEDDSIAVEMGENPVDIDRRAGASRDPQPRHESRVVG